MGSRCGEDDVRSGEDIDLGLSCRRLCKSAFYHSIEFQGIECGTSGASCPHL